MHDCPENKPQFRTRLESHAYFLLKRYSKTTKILIIEDENSLRQEMVDWLTFENYEVMEASDGLEGVEVTLLNRPDLIVSDISMPKLDGYGVLLEIQANSELNSTPFIFLTAKTTHDDIRHGMQLGADDYLTKPCSRAELLDAIRVRLEKKARHDRERQNQLNAFKEALGTEQEKRLLQTKLVAMFSHDFRNQLMVIRSSAIMVQDYSDRLTAQRRAERLEAIKTSSDLLLEMIDDMLNLAQMDMHSFELKPKPLDVSQFCHDIIQEFRTVAGETHYIHFKNEFSKVITTDSRLLRKILANLISNAIKYSPENTEITVSLDSDEKHYMLCVEDQGIGIPEADLERLASTFYRASNVGNIEGTGLGLAIVHQAIELLEGSIQVDSQVGIGTTITVTLPIATENQR